MKVGNYHLKNARYGSAVVADGNGVYVIAGNDGREYLGDIERFDINTHEVVRLTDRLTARRYHGAVVVDGRIYVIGGESVPPLCVHVQSEPAVDIYDLSTGAISHGAPLPTPRSNAAVVLFKGRVYVIGGSLMDRQVLAQTGLVEIYDPATDRWSTGPAMPTARECRAAVVNDRILVPGGYRAHARLACVEFLVPSENAWKQLPDLCERVSACSVASLGSQLFLFGNYDAEKDVVAYDLRAHTSRVFHPGFLPVRHTAAVSHGGRIYVVGGVLSVASVTAFDDIQVFALAAP